VTAHVKAARILIDCSSTPEASWCWRPEWYCGSDSIYGLLAKFGSLNALSHRELCELFVERNPLVGVKHAPGRPHFPTVDLRYSRGLRVGRLANLLRLDAAEVQMGFVESLFPNATELASTDLIWCPACARNGFHCCSFQLNYSCVCPLHGHTLLRRCVRCSSPVPYRLCATTRGELFCCPSCGKDLAVAFRSPRRSLEMDPDAAALFADHSEMLRFSDQLPTMINACRASLERPHMPLYVSKPDLHRRSASFRQFVADMLTSVSGCSPREPQVSLNPMAPNYTYTDAAHSLPLVCHSPRAAQANHAGKSVASESDHQLQEAWSIYRCIRRHLWRHHVCRHRRCAQLAMRTLWWDLEGETIPSFCGVALAFIRWRMQWEGRRIPSTLVASDRGCTPYGLLGWISSDLPIASVRWLPRFEAWLNAHILGAACVDSFVGWMTLSAEQEARGTLQWRRRDHESFPRRHWACSGRGSSDEPGYLFIEQLTFGGQLTEEVKPERYSRTHIQATRRALASVKR